MRPDRQPLVPPGAADTPPVSAGPGRLDSLIGLIAGSKGSASPAGARIGDRRGSREAEAVRVSLRLYPDRLTETEERAS